MEIRDNRSRSKRTYPYSSDQQRARYARQIAAGKFNMERVAKTA